MSATSGGQNPLGISSLSALSAGLSSVLGVAHGVNEPITILARVQHEYVSSHPSEIVTCQLADGSVLDLFCKYSAAAGDHLKFGHRGGITREDTVYRTVLHATSVSAPRYYGTFEDPSTQSTCLVTEYLDNASKFSKVHDGHVHAARWIAHFHALNAQRAADTTLTFLPRYDAAYYRGWIDRTIEYAAPLESEFHWLSDLERHAINICDVLQTAPVTVIHGEFYNANVLVRDGVIFPVDWESAAIAPGELDLASLTQGWKAPEVRACELAYCRSRWPEGTPTWHAQVLLAARIYFHVRWLGEKPAWTSHKGYRATADDLKVDLANWPAIR